MATATVEVNAHFRIRRRMRERRQKGSGTRVPGALLQALLVSAALLPHVAVAVQPAVLLRRVLLTRGEVLSPPTVKQ